MDKPPFIRSTAFAAVLASILSTAGLTAQAKPGPSVPRAPAPTRPALVIGVLPDLDSIPIVIASMKGYFDAEGLDARIERFTSAQARDAALQTGAIDLAVSDLLAACFFAEGGFKARAVMATDGLYRLVAAPGSTASGLKDLEGKSVAISKNTIIEYCLGRMLEAEGMPASSVELVIIPQMPVRLQMLSQGKVDAAILPEPLATQAMLDGASLLDDSARLGVNLGVVIASERALASKASVIAAFERAYDRAVAYLKAAPRSEWIDALIEKAGLPPSVRDAIVLPAYSPARPPARAEAEAVAAWLYGRELVKRIWKAEDIFLQ